MDVLDDHSRLVVAARVCSGPTSEAAWAAVCDAAQAWGLPAHILSDNGSCFTGRFFSNGAEIDFVVVHCFWVFWIVLVIVLGS